MSTDNYKPGLGNVASYQVAGIPYVTGGIDCSASTVGLEFPLVTNWIAVTNHDSANHARVGFSKNGVEGTNYFRLHKDQSSGPPTPIVFNVKATEIWISGSTSVDVVAGLTGIETLSINNANISPDGRNWSGSAGALVG